jgi:hypothetical protein
MDASEFETIMEELIARDSSTPIDVLRQLCLYSVINNGIKLKIYDSLRHEFLQVTLCLVFLMIVFWTSIYSRI